jgi:dTDP-6-deoxy-L-talose 4-dehydrogenase (NAD+)
MYGVAKNALREVARLEVEKAGGVFQWLRAYYILGDDERNQSLFTKILGWEAEGKATFPFNSGLNKYDFIDVRDLARQIALVSLQTKVAGVIDCCSGVPMALRDRVEAFIADNGLAIRPEYGAFPDRPYDSPAVWGSIAKINRILADAPGAGA